jgi:cytosine/adenosine deaminase-related metal-dependent hydrolase
MSEFALPRAICFDGAAMTDPLPPAPPRTIIRDAAWLVAWDEAAQSHVYRREVDLMIEGDTIAAVGSAGPSGPGDDSDAVEIDGRGFAILPGFVDIHAHPSSEPMLKGLTDEVGSRQLYMSSLYEYLPLFEVDAEGRRTATEVALCELMQSGVTTVCDLLCRARGLARHTRRQRHARLCRADVPLGPLVHAKWP